MIPLSDADAPAKTAAPVTKAIIGLNLLVFLYELALGGLGFLFGADGLRLTIFFLTWGFIPRELTEGIAYESFITAGDIDTPVPTWGTLVTSMFIHGGLLHLAGNMMFLWVFGANLEARLGYVWYVLFYFVTGVLAALCHWVVESGSPVPLVGASGAIAGVMGAYLMLYPRNRINSLVIFYFITVIRLSAFWLLGFWFALQLLQALLTFGVSAQVSVAFWAHVGGFVAGVGIIAIYKLVTGQPVLPTRGPPSPPSHPGSPSRYWRGRRLD